MFQGVVDEGALEAGCTSLSVCLADEKENLKDMDEFQEVKSDTHPYWHTEMAQMFAVRIN